MSLFLQHREVLAQRSGESREVVLRPLEIVVVRDEVRLHGQSGQVLRQQIGITARAHGCRKVRSEGRPAGGVIRIELQQSDELPRLGFHVDQKLRRLPPDDRNHIERFVGDELDEGVFVGEEGRLGVGDRFIEHQAIKCRRGERRSAA